MFPTIYGVLARPSGFDIETFFHEEFSTAQVAPLVAPFNADGAGVWTAVVNGAAMSISGGELLINSSGVAGLNGYDNDSNKFTVENGKVAVWRIAEVISGTRQESRLVSNKNIGYDLLSIRGVVGVINNVATKYDGSKYYAHGTSRGLLIDDDVLLMVEGFAGVISADFFIDTGVNAAVMSNVSQVSLKKPHGNWDNIESMRTAVIASPSGGEAGDVDKDSNFYVRLSALPTTTATIAIRSQDGNNRWEINITSGGVMTLDEVVAGTPVTRITVAGVTAGDVICCHANDEAIGLVRYASGQTMVRDTGAANFKTETGYEIVSLGGATLANFEAWNTRITGEDLARLEAM